ncbi:hypothetical protein JG688_00009689 [Phytophthora aleatoria]|uniref:Uncharacterized protein n=1 Tax=Phytophthora aleatoria TaxID=2496075 RepID=A0A8J5M3V1_9STRA|nr:hypothetical protein JG688_00009689 [Phytophthora aleatoria]
MVACSDPRASKLQAKFEEPYQVFPIGITVFNGSTRPITWRRSTWATSNHSSRVPWEKLLC